jgi:hypothetical protein
MVQAGLTPLQAISVAMKNGAQLLRVEDGSVNLIWPLSIVSFGPTPTLVIMYSS